MAKQALEGSRLNAFAVDPNSLTIVGIDTNHKAPTEHALYDERIKLPVDEATVRSIMALGFISVVDVFKDGDDVLVVDGRQRVRAAREANKRLAEQGAELVQVVCMVKRGDDAKLLGLMIAKNELRQDNTPMQRARLVERYMDLGKSEEDAAIVFGLSVQSIKNMLKLIDLAPAVQKAIDDGKLSANAALPLAALSRDEQVEALPGVLEAGGTANNAREKVAAARGSKAKTRPGIKDIKDVLENEHLSAHAAHALRWVLGEEESAQP